MNVATFIARRLHALGVAEAFSVVGGGAMFLNDAFGREFAGHVHYLHHEQAAAMAAEGYARVENRPAAVVVTTGPGAVNALNGVFGAFTDSIPMIVVGGQVKRETIVDRPGVPTGLRQLGDQEARTLDVVATMTKQRRRLEDPAEVASAVDAAWLAAVGGRPAPVWLEVPVDVQGAPAPDDPCRDLPERPPAEPPSPATVERLLEDLKGAQRPLILAGTGVRLAGVAQQLLLLAERLGVPIATAWTHDLLPSDHRLSAGRPGTIGTRAGNLLLQASDHLLVLGSRLNIRQVSYAWDSFAADATITWVDVDPAELDKPYLRRHRPVVADLRALVPAMLAAVPAEVRPSPHETWTAACRAVRASLEPRWTDYPMREGGINPYHLVMRLFEVLSPEAVVVCGNASACIIPFQVGRLRDGQRMFSNSGSASMGYDLPAAIGAAIADPARPVVAIAGDGSLMMNLQELQTLAAFGANVVVVVLENQGYLSIKQTQSNFFGMEHGASPQSGITFPDFAAVAGAFGLPSVDLTADDDWPAKLASAIRAGGPRVVVAHLDPSQEFEPRLRSRMVNGRIVTPALDDMYPHLADAELAAARALARGAVAQTPRAGGGT